MNNVETKDNLILDWNDTIEDVDRIILPEGDYNFMVVGLERSRFPGSEKIPPCPKACITIQIMTEQGSVNLKTDLLLYRSLEWRISSFFRCIGQKKKGERLAMNWSKVVNSIGRAHIKQRVYTTQYGEEKIVNDVDRFIDYNEEFFEIDDPSLPF